MILKPQQMMVLAYLLYLTAQASSSKVHSNQRQIRKSQHFQVKAIVAIPTLKVNRSIWLKDQITMVNVQLIGSLQMINLELSIVPKAAMHILKIYLCRPIQALISAVMILLQIAMVEKCTGETAACLYLEVTNWTSFIR